MSSRRANRILAILSMIVLVVTIVVVGIGLRAEGTRNIVERVDSVCARAYGDSATDVDRDECNRILQAAALHRPLADTCVIQRQTLKSRWYEVITRCPPVSQIP
jgi:hypothetical protein